MVRLGSHTVTIIRRPVYDRFGDPAGAPTETDVTGCFVQPHTSAEQTDQRDQVITGLKVFMPPGTDIVATDKVRFNGALYQVDGDPARWDDSRGVPHHLEVAFRQVEG